MPFVCNVMCIILYRSDRHGCIFLLLFYFICVHVGGLFYFNAGVLLISTVTWTQASIVFITHDSVYANAGKCRK